MDVFKEFQGKSLNNAIEEACSYFNVSRHQLEIEILRDAKTGIFGIVGSRKAAIRARRVHLEEAVSSVLGTESHTEKEIPVENQGPDAEQPVHTAEQGESLQKEDSPKPRRKGGGNATPRGRRPQQKNARGRDKGERQEQTEASQPSAEALEKTSREAAGERKTQSRAQKKLKHAEREESPVKAQHSENTPQSFAFEDMPDDIPEGLPLITDETIASPAFQTFLSETLTAIIRPIVGGEVRLETEVSKGRVRVHMDSGEDSGLLIGREGQTLVAIQYLTTRILTHKFGAAVRLQLDAGEYRHRQEEKLSEIALALAERARQTGHSFSTKPLSSYHRRLVHLALKNEQDIQTRSVGPGSMKRVIIMRKRPEKHAAAQEAVAADSTPEL